MRGDFKKLVMLFMMSVFGFMIAFTVIGFVVAPKVALGIVAFLILALVAWIKGLWKL